jgi:hypothetical protein
MNRFHALGVIFLTATTVAGLAAYVSDVPAAERHSALAPAAIAPPDLQPPPDDASGGGAEPERPDRPFGEDAGPEFFELRKLSDGDVNRIRFLELRAFRPRIETPDRVTVDIPRDVVDDFLVEMEGHPDFRGELTRREFYKLTPPQKLHFIARHTDALFVDRITIETDPETFLDFRRRVMPTILQGCATAGCHSPTWPDAAKFGLFKDPKKLPETTYANFIILNDLAVSGAPLINRARPEESLLLTYLLPHKEVKIDMRHPGDIELKPVYQSRRAQGYRRIEQWIRTLREPRPDYGVRLVPEPRGRSMDDPDDAEAPATNGEPSSP